MVTMGSKFTGIMRNSPLMTSNVFMVNIFSLCSCYNLISMFMALLTMVLADDKRLSVCPGACACVETNSKLTVKCSAQSKTPIIVADGIHTVDLLSVNNVDSFFNHSSWSHVESLSIYTQHNIETRANTFQNLVAIQNLKIAHIHLYDFDPRCLSNLHNLNSLSLINSTNLEFNEVALILRHLGNKTLRFLNLTMTNIYPNVNMFTYNFWKSLMDLDLEILDLSHIGLISAIDKDLTDLIDQGHSFRNLKELYAYGTYINGYGHSGFDLFDLFGLFPGIRKSILGGISFPIPPDQSCDESRYSCDEFIHAATNITEIGLSDTNLFKRCYIQYTCPTIIYKSLVRISFENINTKRIEVELALTAPNLEEVDLRRNHLVYLIPTVFKGLKNLRVVRLGGNRIGSNKDFPLVELLSFSENLKHFDICCNQLKFIPENIFRANRKLRTIDLSHNELNSLHLSINHLINIELLNLNGNQLKYIDEHSLKNINSLMFLRKNPFLDLRDNNVTCSCEQSSFINQLIDIKGALIAPETYTCVFDSQLKPLFSIDKGDIEFTCYVLLLKTSLSCFGVIVLCIVVGAICYRKRLVFLKLYVRLRFWRYRNRRMNATDRVFVAYSMKDKDFALKMFNKINPVLQNLLQTEEDVLYINDKHFRVPGDIDEEIVRGVRSCRCTIPIVSEDFIKSAWANLEISLTWAEKKPILPVFLSEVKRRQLKGVLEYYYDRKTRLLFPTNDENQDMFWQTLLVGIADILNKRKELSTLPDPHDPAVTMATQRETNILETYI